MIQATHSTFDAAGFDTFLDSRIEPDWLLDLRREAWQHAQAMQWPDRRHEEWIRTDIRTFQLEKFGLPATTAGDTIAAHQLLDGVDLAGSIETVDSCLVRESLEESYAAKGVVFGSLERLCR